MLGVPQCLCSSLTHFRYFSLHCLVCAMKIFLSSYCKRLGQYFLQNFPDTYFIFEGCVDVTNTHKSRQQPGEQNETSACSLLRCFLRLHSTSTILCLSKYLRLASKSINTYTLWQGNICKYILFELILTQEVRTMCTRIFPKNFLITIVLCRP